MIPEIKLFQPLKKNKIEEITLKTPYSDALPCRPNSCQNILRILRSEVLGKDRIDQNTQ